MRVIASLVTGLALTVAPARAQEPDVLPVPTGQVMCAQDGPNCVASRATMIGMAMAIEVAKQKLTQQAEALQAQAEALADLREELAAERARGPHCAEVRKIPVPGTRS
jgi:hypothetical protein